VVKINFPGSAARQKSFTANANQSNESVTVVKINIQSGTNQFTAVEIDFYHGALIFLPWWEILYKF